MSHALQLIGKKFGMLTVIERAESNKEGRSMWLCKCDCGNLVTVLGKDLRRGHTSSCGCYKSIVPKMRRIMTQEDRNGAYASWKNIRQRCYNPRNPEYKWYGGRGIKMCEEWNDSREFLKWCKANGWKKGLDVDRIDNNGDYEPSNCQFLTRSANVKKQGKKVMVDGEEMLIPDFSELAGYHRNYGNYLFRTKGEAAAYKKLYDRVVERRAL